MIKSLHPQRPNRKMSEFQKEDLIRQYLPLVRKTMRQFLRKGEHEIDKIEIFENGILGLVQALETYSYEDNLPFPQYAERFIQEYISQGLKAAHSSPVDLLPLAHIEEDLTEGLENEIEKRPLAPSGKAHDVFDFKASDPLTSMLNDENSRLIEIALNRIPSPERRIIRMTFYDNLSLSKIGRSLGISEREVSELRSSGLRRLRKHLLMHH